MIKIWFVATDGEQSGPLSVPEVKELRMQGRVTEATYVWREGMDNWMPIGSVGELGWIVSVEITDAPALPVGKPVHSSPAAADRQDVEAATTIQVDCKKRPQVSLSDGFGSSHDIVKLKKPGGNRISLIAASVVAVLVIASLLLKPVIFKSGPDNISAFDKNGNDLMKCVRRCVADTGNDTAKGYEKCRHTCETKSTARSTTQRAGINTIKNNTTGKKNADVGFPDMYVGGKLEWEGTVVRLFGNSADVAPAEIDCGASVVRAAWDEKLLLVEIKNTSNSNRQHIMRYYADYDHYRDVPAPEQK